MFFYKQSSVIANPPSILARVHKSLPSDILNVIPTFLEDVKLLQLFSLLWVNPMNSYDGLTAQRYCIPGIDTFLSSWMDSSDFVIDFIDDFTDICKITPYATLKPSDVCCNYCS